ncbi:phosphatidylethanolamine-binding protein homolog F40A3.3-like [Cylas formicarius]|uniref:phosphatidylethanolamine-binding protein homolog F40A3.3-like n=1 Tax=Cylas formicarius TaxID=197179 RepID=UPI0029586B1D|nr:phosphatidylethanolamine-binding protein homolog F40A3.3-like [Cylas formicarius]
MEKHRVVPDVVEVVPDQILEIKYPSGVSVNLGNELTPTQVKDVPSVSWKADPNAYYTLIFTDPDNRHRDVPYQEWHHWLVVNIPGNSVAKGEVLSAYIGSGPPQGTGVHRYVFLVYKQPGKLKFDEPVLGRSVEKRGNFFATKFANKYKLGQPVAGNFYLAQFDSYVPQLYKELGA